MPKTNLRKALYSARHVYRLGYKRMGRAQYIAAQAGLAGLLLTAGLGPVANNLLRAGSVHAAGGYTIDGGAAASGRVNQQIAISDISIGGTGDATVPIKLTVDSGFLSLSTTTGLTFSGPSGGASVQFSGTRSNVNAALATLHYSSTAVGSATLEITVAGAQTVYNPDNGHVYAYIDSNVSWQDAHDEAATLNYQGTPGYLATITSSDENEFIQTKLSGDAWLGASDGDSYGGEDHWEWTSGPETGTNFYNGRGNFGGAAVDGAYTNWAGGEPNQAGDEDCMETYIASGTWNDFPCGSHMGYVVEYGEDGDLPPAIPVKDVSITTTAAVFPGGDGSPGAPYQITDCERLQDMNQDLSAHYVLTHDVDCTETVGWNGGQGFTPVGDGENEIPFTGTLDGAGYKIISLTEIRADEDPYSQYGDDPFNNQRYVGLFGYVAGGTIHNVHLTNAMIKGYEYVGGLVGYMENGTITDSTVNTNLTSSTDGTCNDHCIWARYGQEGGGLVGHMNDGSIGGSSTGGPVKGSGNIIGGLVGYAENGAEITSSTTSSPIDGGTYIGGAVGEAYDTTLQHITATGKVIAKVADENVKYGQYAGGLVGYAGTITVELSRASGDVHADTADAGGLIGNASNSTFHDVYATGNVDAGNYEAGGLIGYGYANDIARAYASGSVESNDAVGGLIGYMDSNHTIDDSFAVGAVSGNSNVGGLIGNAFTSTLTHDYYDATNTGQADCAGSGVLAGCTAINTAGYFVHKSNAPFTQSGSEVWLGSVWLFDKTNLPVFGITTPDDDDGITAATEDAAPNSGDANNDGTADSQQANVAAFVDPVSGKYVGLAVDGACDLSDISIQNQTALISDGGYKYPLGLLNFTADCGTPGHTTTVTQYYYNPPAGDFILRKLVDGSYQTVSGATISHQTIGGQAVLVVSYQLKDGGPLDTDGTANGTIVDPVGLALSAAAASTSTGAPDTGLLHQSMSLYVVASVTGLVLIIGLASPLRRKVYGSSRK